MHVPMSLNETLVRAGNGVDADGEDHRLDATDTQAFVALFREHYAALAGYLLRRTGCRHATEDLLSEVFLAAYRGLPRYRDLGRPMRAWLYGIATHLVWRWLRSRRRAEPLDAAAHVADPRAPGAGSVAAADEAVRARALLESLPRRFQDVLALHYLEELGIEETAAALDLRPGTVKSRLSRGRVRLRRLLEGRRR